MHWLSSHLFLFFSWLDVRPVCVYIASLWLFTWNISPSHLSLHDCSSYSSIWQSLSLPPFLLPLILNLNPVTHTPIFLVCFPSFLPFRLGSRVFSPSLPEGTQPPTSSLCTFGLLAYTGPCPYRWRVHSICSRYRTHVEEHYRKSRHCTRNCQIF